MVTIVDFGAFLKRRLKSTMALKELNKEWGIKVGKITFWGIARRFLWQLIWITNSLVPGYGVLSFNKWVHLIWKETRCVCETQCPQYLADNDQFQRWLRSQGWIFSYHFTDLRRIYYTLPNYRKSLTIGCIQHLNLQFSCNVKRNGMWFCDLNYMWNMISEYFFRYKACVFMFVED